MREKERKTEPEYYFYCMFQCSGGRNGIERKIDESATKKREKQQQQQIWFFFRRR